MNTTKLPPSSSSTSNQFPLTHALTLRWVSPPPSSTALFTSTTTTTTFKPKFPFRAQATANHTNPGELSLTTTTTDPPPNSQDQTLLILLRQRKTEEAWLIYTQCAHLPSPTCLSRLVSQLSYQNTQLSLTRAQSIIQRLRHERQLHRLDANSLGLLAVAAAKAGQTLYSTSIIKSMLQSGYLPHVKAWSAVVSRLAASGDDGPSEALKLFNSVIRRVRRFADPKVVADSRPDTAAYNAVLNACANLGHTQRFLQLFDEMPELGCQPDVLTYNVMIKLCARADRKDLLVYVLERILEKEIPLCMTTLHSLVAAYIGFGDLETAEKMVQAMREGRQDLCKVIRDSIARKGRCERASIDEVYLDLTDAAEAMLAETPPENLERIDEEAIKSHVVGLNEDVSELKENVREWLHRSDADHRDKLLACGALIVAELRMQVLKETQFTCSAGIAHNKMLAKLASGMNKPAQQTVVPFAYVKGLLEPLPIKKMKQLGGKLGSSLQIDLGVNTVGELLQFSEEKLQERYGINTGTWLWNIARGISGEEVEGRLLPKSHGSGKTFPGPRALKTIASVEHWVNELCEELSERLHSDLEQNKRIAHTLTLHATAFKSSDTESHKKFPSKSCPLRYGTAKIKEDALNLFQAGLREYLGSHRIKTDGNRYKGWGITGLSVSASKIVAIPSGTCSIMKYFHGQDQSCCSSTQVNDRFVPEAAPLSPSGSDSYSGLHPTEPPIEFHEEEMRIMHAMPSLDQQENKREVCTREETCETMQFADVQNTSCSLSEPTQDEFIQETSALPSSGTESCLELDRNEPHQKFHREEIGIKYLMHGIRPQEQKRKTVKDKGSSSILRFFQSCSNSSSSPKQEDVRTIDESIASSSLSCVGLPIEAELPKENLLARMGAQGGMSTSGLDEVRRDAWDYKIDEIDPSVVNELPPEIQEEVRAWLRPQKRANIAKRGSSIAHYFLPTKNT